MIRRRKARKIKAFRKRSIKARIDFSQPVWQWEQNTLTDGKSADFTALNRFPAFTRFCTSVSCVIIKVNEGEQTMKFEWDEEKNAANKEKHRISFETAAHVFDDP